MHLLGGCGYHLLLSVSLFVKVLNDPYLLCLLCKISTLIAPQFNYSFYRTNALHGKCVCGLWSDLLYRQL